MIGVTSLSHESTTNTTFIIHQLQQVSCEIFFVSLDFLILFSEVLYDIKVQDLLEFADNFTLKK